MYERELIGAIKCKEKGYENICNCRNKKVMRSSLAIVESSERINMRGVFLKEVEDKLILEFGYTTAKNVLEQVVMPIIKQYSLSKIEVVVQDKLDEMNSMKSRKGFRLNANKLIRGLYYQCRKELLESDLKFGNIKFDTLVSELMYSDGVWREKKINAHNNKLKRLSRKTNTYEV